MDGFRRRHDRDQVNVILSSLQKTTRILQSICGHSKVTQNVALTNQVPMTRKVLENLILRVRSMLEVNDCLQEGVFMVGTLKNKKLNGEVADQEYLLAAQEAKVKAGRKGKKQTTGGGRGRKRKESVSSAEESESEPIEEQEADDERADDVDTNLAADNDASSSSVATDDDDGTEDEDDD